MIVDSPDLTVDCPQCGKTLGFRHKYRHLLMGVIMGDTSSVSCPDCDILVNFRVVNIQLEVDNPREASGNKSASCCQSLDSPDMKCCREKLSNRQRQRPAATPYRKPCADRR